MKNPIYLFLLITSFGFSQTPITDDNFHDAITICLSTNPVDGLCYDSEYGAMPNWDVSQVTDMSFAFFHDNDFNADLSSWDVSNVENMSGMFYHAYSFNKNIGTWNVSNVTNMAAMFYHAYSFNKNIGTWNVSNVTNMAAMFYHAHSFNKNIGTWDVSNVTNMAAMFTSSPFNQDISSWDVSNVVNMDGMFTYAYDFNQDISSWDVSNVENMSGMFYHAHSFNKNIGTWNVSNVFSMGDMFNFSGLSTEIYDSILQGWSSQDLNNYVELGAYDKYYCNSGPARDSLIQNLGWSIYDAGIDFSCYSSNTENLATNPLSIYPNPTQDVVTISLESPSKGVLKAYDLQGRLIHSQPIQGHSSLDYNIEGEAGLYLIEFVDERGEVYVGKVVKM